MKRVPAVLALLALIGGALVLHLTKPSDEDLQGPFVTYAGFGERSRAVTSRGRRTTPTSPTA